MDAEEKELYQEAHKLIEDLKKYCHAPECNNWDNCPLNHKNCLPRLNYDTAIIWELAEIIGNMIYCGLLSESSQTLMIGARAIIRVARMHETKYEYRNLRSLIPRIPRFFRKIYLIKPVLV